MGLLCLTQINSVWLTSCNLKGQLRAKIPLEDIKSNDNKLDFNFELVHSEQPKIANQERIVMKWFPSMSRATPDYEER